MSRPVLPLRAGPVIQNALFCKDSNSLSLIIDVNNFVSNDFLSQGLTQVLYI